MPWQKAMGVSSSLMTAVLGFIPTDTRNVSESGSLTESTWLHWDQLTDPAESWPEDRCAQELQGRSEAAAITFRRSPWLGNVKTGPEVLLGSSLLSFSTQNVSSFSSQMPACWPIAYPNPPQTESRDFPRPALSPCCSPSTSDLSSWVHITLLEGWLMTFL